MRAFPSRVGLVLTLTASIAALSAEQPAPAAAQGEPITIDFFAAGPDGPVFDLRTEEITLKINGRARPVRSLRYISLPPPDPAAPVTTSVPFADLEPPFGTNT